MANSRLKFRAWSDATLNGSYKMFPHESVVSNCAAYICDDKYYSHRVIMQDSRFKDKSGADIYEGDIITNQVIIGVVEFTKGMFVFNYNSKDFQPEALRYVPTESFEIIGNIYEDPDVLTKQD